MICHCKVACTNNTLSLMFGCKVGRGSCLFNACCLLWGCEQFFCLFICLPVGRVTEARTCSAVSGSWLVLGALRVHSFTGVRCWVGNSVVTGPWSLSRQRLQERICFGKGAPWWLSAWDLVIRSQTHHRLPAPGALTHRTHGQSALAGAVDCT